MQEKWCGSSGGNKEKSRNAACELLVENHRGNDEHPRGYSPEGRDCGGKKVI